jgi:hypothetical protein
MRSGSCPLRTVMVAVRAHPDGPLALADLIGLGTRCTRWPARYTAGLLGRKGGRVFVDYRPAEHPPHRSARAPEPHPAPRCRKAIYTQCDRVQMAFLKRRGRRQLLSCWRIALKKTSDVSRTKFACVEARVLAQSAPALLAACSWRSSRFFSSRSYPSNQIKPFCLACSAICSPSSRTRWAAASISAVLSGVVGHANDSSGRGLQSTSAAAEEDSTGGAAA